MKNNNSKKSTGEKMIKFAIGRKKNVEITELQDDLKKLDNAMKNIDHNLKKLF